ncbi:MAG TPA: hypothetical protein VGD45_20535 [Steroidobacter sp.]|uniref:hypothetical protein n=1 Tax=Steroidobacter sp. TaxID=1978227 RepID=UPI002ED930B3
MNIEEIKQKREQLRSSIRQLITQFESETRCSVTSVDVSRVTIDTISDHGVGKTVVSDVDVTVVLP